MIDFNNKGFFKLKQNEEYAQRVTDLPDPTKDLYPFKRNEKYGIGDRPITPEKINGNYNNF